MGNMHAEEYACLADEGLGLDLALEMHLLSNHYPPIPLSMIDVAKEAIELVREGYHEGTLINNDTWNTELELPENVLWHGKTSAPIRALFSSLHLDAFI